MKFYKQLSSIVVGISLLSTPVFAQTPEEKGLAIAEERKARDLGWGDSISQAEMILRNAQGQETIRKMRLKSLEVENDGDKALTIFDQPQTG